MCLTGRCSLCINAKEEVKMIDWNKPLQVLSFQNPDVTKVGIANNGQVIVESATGTLYRACPETGTIDVIGRPKVTNRLEPWEQAWKQYNDTHQLAMYMKEEDYFKHVFELGRTWDQKKKQ